MQGLGDFRVSMPQNHRSPRTDVVHVTIAIDIVQIRPVSTLENNRLPANCTERPRRTIDPAGHQLLGSGENFMTLRTIHGELSPDDSPADGKREKTPDPRFARDARKT
jgi:hypothetical protein